MTTMTTPTIYSFSYRGYSAKWVAIEQKFAIVINGYLICWAATAEAARKAIDEIA